MPLSADGLEESLRSHSSSFTYQPRTSKEPMDFHGEGEQMTIPTLKKVTKIPMRTMRPIKNLILTRTSKNGLQNLHPSYDTLVKTFLTWKLSITVLGAHHKFSHHESPTTFFIKFSNFLRHYNYPLFPLILFKNTLFDN